MDLHTNDSSESAAGVFVSDKCQIPVMAGFGAGLTWGAALMTW